MFFVHLFFLSLLPLLFLVSSSSSSPSFPPSTSSSSNLHPSSFSHSSHLLLAIECPGEDRDELLPLGSLRNAIAVDYDYSGNCAFWADIADRDIKRACLDGNSENQRLVGLNGTVEGLAYDWISENLYWVETTTVKIEICRKVNSRVMQMCFDV